MENHPVARSEAGADQPGGKAVARLDKLAIADTPFSKMSAGFSA